MIVEYFISLYFRLLRWQLHHKRLDFFIELRDFNLIVKSNEFGYNMWGFLEKILYNYTQMMRLIVKIEKLEKYIKRWDIFDALFYSQQLNRDILGLIRPIEEQLTEKLTDLRLTLPKLDTGWHTDISLEKSIEYQNDRIRILIWEIELMLSRIQYMKEQLEKNTVFELKNPG